LLETVENLFVAKLVKQTNRKIVHNDRRKVENYDKFHEPQIPVTNVSATKLLDFCLLLSNMNALTERKILLINTINNHSFR